MAPTSSFPHQGLYVITKEGSSNLDLLRAHVEGALRGGARVVQYRAKRAAHPLLEAQALLEVCRTQGVPLLINDDIDLCLKIGADGVHIGHEDEKLKVARNRLGPQAIIGVSCYNSVDRALSAQEDSANYVAFGRFFPSSTKPNAPQADIDTLTLARQELSVPIVAIGGVTAENGVMLLEAGADLLAVIEGVFGAPNPEVAARRYNQLWSPT